MNGAAEIPVFLAILTAALLIAGATITLVGSIGLLRLPSFYRRVHAPTLGTTRGTACVATVSMIYFSALGTRPRSARVADRGFRDGNGTDHIDDPGRSFPSRDNER
jgi:Na+/H+ antiporter subunit